MNPSLTSTAKQVLGWYWQTLKEIGCQTLFCESGCQPVHCTSALLYYAVKLFINFCCLTLSYYSGCQPLHYTCSLVYLCTVHAKSIMNHESCMCNVLSLSTPHFQSVCIWNTIWKRVFILNYVIWNETEWRVIDILLAIDISETQYRTFY